ncbi:hypothetical protein NA56DRAFT_89928 [Hyaloscypha hepaticicola]|uniref:Uncharacterized protein n=1 Tax=Hyaloscypha hepaticicola TaxID=2082293 RepID=A0A2J6Q8H0_9HELO|nr:hypothetical protein NA56DRAFT_89928 [Hyaloscypha hepaticicola]
MASSKSHCFPPSSTSSSPLLPFKQPHRAKSVQVRSELYVSYSLFASNRPQDHYLQEGAHEGLSSKGSFGYLMQIFRALFGNRDLLSHTILQSFAFQSILGRFSCDSTAARVQSKAPEEQIFPQIPHVLHLFHSFIQEINHGLLVPSNFLFSLR